MEGAAVDAGAAVEAEPHSLYLQHLTVVAALPAARLPPQHREQRRLFFSKIHLRTKVRTAAGDTIRSMRSGYRTCTISSSRLIVPW